MVYTRYNGYESVSDIYYGSDEEYEAIKAGTLFKIKGDFDWYYRLVPYENRTGQVISQDLVCVQKLLVTSKKRKVWKYKNLKHDPSAKIYFGQELKDSVVDEVSLWMKSINPRTKKAFSGRDFTSFINAIPAEIIVDVDFCENMKKSMVDVLRSRVRYATSVNEIVGLQSLKRYAENLVDNAHKNAADEFACAVDVAGLETENIETVRVAALKKMDCTGKDKK